MAECILPERDHSAPAPTGDIPLSTEVARTWAVEAGHATIVKGDLRPVEDIDTIGRAVVTIGNSERSVENFALVHKIIDRAHGGAGTISHEVLARTVEAADFMFGPAPDWPQQEVA